MPPAAPPAASARSEKRIPVFSFVLSLHSSAPWVMPEPNVVPSLRQDSRPVYSASRLSTYESCPLQFRFRYIDRIPRTEETIEAYLGSRVHEALSALYHTVQRGDQPSLSDLLQDYHRQWDQRWHNQVKIVKRDRSVDHYKAFGERCLVNYYQAHQPF